MCKVKEICIYFRIKVNFYFGFIEQPEEIVVLVCMYICWLKEEIRCVLMKIFLFILNLGNFDERLGRTCIYFQFLLFRNLFQHLGIYKHTACSLTERMTYS